MTTCAHLALLLAALLALPVTNAEARGPWRAGENNTRGWDLMTPEERIEHQARIRGFTTLPPCLAYREEHHRLMEQRARERGVALRGGGRDFCAHLSADKPVGGTKAR